MLETRAILSAEARVAPLDLLTHVSPPALRPGLQALFAARFLRQLGFALFQKTRANLTLLSSRVRVATQETVLAEMPELLLAGLADLDPLHGRALVGLDAALLGAIVDSMCGATIALPSQRGELSVLETRIGRQLIEAICKNMAETLAPMGLTQIKLAGLESSRNMLAIADSQDWMIEYSGLFETRLGRGMISLVLPFATLDPLEHRLHAGGFGAERAPDAAWALELAKSCEALPMSLRFEVARGALPMSLVCALRPGQMLPLKLQDEAIARCGEVDLFRADYGQYEGHIAARVSKGMNMPNETGPEAETAITLDTLTPAPAGGALLEGAKLLDRVQVMVSVELGRAELAVKDIRALRRGQVIALGQRVGEPLVIYANGYRLAQGEVVAVAEGERYGIRITALAEAEPDEAPLADAAE